MDDSDCSWIREHANSVRLSDCDQQFQSLLADAEEDENGTLPLEMDETEMVRKELRQTTMDIITQLEELETQLEIEKACHENAEVFAVKLTKENQKLQHLSLALQPVWDHLPTDITQLGLNYEETCDPITEPSSQELLQLQEFQETISHLMEEKKQLANKVQQLESQLVALTQQVRKEQSEKMGLQEALEKQNKSLQRFSEVSSLVTREYEDLRQHLQLEQDLRKQAESYAHQMRVKKQEATRQSIILLENTSPSMPLLKALEEVANVTKALEEEKFKHQQQVNELQKQIEESNSKQETERLQMLLCLAEDEKEEMATKLKEAERRSTELESQVKDLQEKLTSAEGSVMEEAMRHPVPPPPPPPPPLPPPLPRESPANPLAELLKRRQKNPTGDGPNTQDSVSLNDLKVKAVNEMMERIKTGVILKPTKRKMELLDPKPSAGGNEGSAVHELKGMLDSMTNRKIRQSSWKSEKKQSELETILLRRRRVTDTKTISGEEDTENPAAPPAGQCESKNPALTSASSRISLKGLKRAMCVQQSRRTSEITALNRRSSEQPEKPAKP
ncbi:shootin-1-like isoform X3 [Stegostoma tigrinum]|uniref:shootin-1-like isoform X3 n=1 Tax=Stegostoma tigrinum TaxID=3053191 RepID=UPI00287015E2|nr:shootin-1-like isoform X3 [Stegostoma tigrinum]